MNNVKEMIQDISPVLEATNKIITDMQDGDRKQISALTEEVSQMTGKDTKQVASFVHYVAHNTSVAYVTRGKKGGLIKGVKPAKIVKPAQTTTTE